MTMNNLSSGVTVRTCAGYVVRLTKPSRWAGMLAWLGVPRVNGRFDWRRRTMVREGDVLEVLETPKSFAGGEA